MPTTVTLCVLLWANDGRQEDLGAYEDAVLGLLPDHGAAVVFRARTEGGPGEPTEVQVLSFPDGEALDAFMGDSRRTELGDWRDRAVARTQVLRVERV